MAVAESGIKVADGGVSLSLGRTFGARRLKALLLLSQLPELDDVDWKGSIELHFGGRSVKGELHRQLGELAA
jgi:hypothetical protein